MNFLNGGKAELILFLPISQMYRFANKSLRDEDYAGGMPLREFLTTISKSEIDYNSPDDFIDQLKISFREYLKEQKIFVDTFTLERDSQNI